MCCKKVFGTNSSITNILLQGTQPDGKITDPRARHSQMRAGNRKKSMGNPDLVSGHRRRFPTRDFAYPGWSRRGLRCVHFAHRCVHFTRGCVHFAPKWTHRCQTTAIAPRHTHIRSLSSTLIVQSIRGDAGPPGWPCRAMSTCVHFALHLGSWEALEGLNTSSEPYTNWNVPVNQMYQSFKCTRQEMF